MKLRFIILTMTIITIIITIIIITTKTMTYQSNNFWGTNNTARRFISLN